MKRWINRISTFTVGIATGVIGVAIQGIIGNRSDAGFVSFIPWISKSVNENAIPWIIICFLIIVICSGSVFYWQHNKILSLTVKRANKLAELDNSLLRTIASWIPSPNRTE